MFEGICAGDVRATGIVARRKSVDGNIENVERAAGNGIWSLPFEDPGDGVDDPLRPLVVTPIFNGLIA
jgi:hypothetical protein